jgi:hypothetical protein
VWADVLGTTWLNARPLARYLAFMFVAGVIALLRRDRRERHPDRRRDGGQPDLLPITAVAVGALFALAQDALDLIPSGFNVHEVGVLGSLTSVNDGTIAVALAAGVAGMLALETRAS